MANTFQVPLLFTLMLASAQAFKTPKLGMLGGHMRHRRSLTSFEDTYVSSHGFEIRNYSQTLDHFNYGPQSNIIFGQRYAISFKYWGGANTSSPIFLCTGSEAGLYGDLVAGFLIDNAPHFKALLVFVEHRYYGKSNPFGSKKEAYSNSSTLQYFSSPQALADYAQLITDLKKNLSAESSPVIVFGGSYGGMLAAWFRLKYPHIAIGALASSAPILYFEDITPENAYYNVVSKDFRETSENCYETIKSSWSDIDKIATRPNGLTTLSQMFKTCRPLSNVEQLKDELIHLYTRSAQYDDPKGKPVAALCGGIDKESYGTSVLQKIISGLKTAKKNFTCFDVGYPEDEGIKYERLHGWTWQRCTEMVMPIGISGKDSMFQASPFDMNNYSLRCQQLFNVTPRPHWITTKFGGHNIKQVLENFGSNIIFSNGLRDPYSSGGVLENISTSIVALVTPMGSHCLDMLGSQSTDPEWLISQRNREVKILKSWIADYNAK